MVKRSRDQSQEAPRRRSCLRWCRRIPPSTPRPLEKFFAAQVAATGLLAFHQLPLDDHLRRDAGVIRARLPQHVLAPHALEAAENILQRIVERMAHMQVAGDIRRRNDDGESLGAGALRPSRPERALSSQSRDAPSTRRDRKSCPSSRKNQRAGAPSASKSA